MNWYKIVKEIYQAYILSLSLFDFCAEYIMENKESETGNKILVNLSYRNSPERNELEKNKILSGLIKYIRK